jgi:phenylacetic acid degradation operon negative regulatory protein
MSFSARCDALIAQLLERHPVRSKSLLMTIYGDALEPHGGNVWLGSLIRLVEPLGISERLVRTSVFRLTKENWLTSQQVGRRSYYQLTDRGRRQFGTAELRIYNDPAQAWDGLWQMVFISALELDSDTRDAIRQELAWQGFGMIAPDVFTHPTASLAPVVQLLDERGLRDRAILMRSQQLDASDQSATEAMVRRCWKLNEIEADYCAFIDQFRPLLDAARHNDDLPDETAFLLRTLLIHEFRRVLLRDAQLPGSLLPAHWAGHSARRLCRELYAIIHARAEAHLLTVCETENGPLPAANREYHARFGGLPH